MKANTTPRISGDPELVRELKAHAALINLMTDGRLAGTNNAQTAAPTTGTYAIGDFVKNSAPAEAGAVSSKYVVIGWVYTAAGFLECRFLTGN